jgi:hypothetical protein
MQPRDPFSQFNECPEVVDAIKALPPAERYLPLYEAIQILESSLATPLDQALLALIEVPEDTHGALEIIAEDCHVHRRTVYRHDDSLRCKLARVVAGRLIYRLQVNRQEHHVLNIQKFLEEKIKQLN